MNNYNDNLSSYKYRSTDIFNTNLNHPAYATPQTGKKIVKDLQKSDIFGAASGSTNNAVRQSPVKTHHNKSSIFNSSGPAPQEITYKKKAAVQRPNTTSDIFLRNSQPETQQRFGKKVMEKERKEPESQDLPKQGKKIDTINKRKDHNDILSNGQDKSYIVKKDKTKDFAKAEAKMEKLRESYVVNDEKYGYMSSKINHGSDQSYLYKGHQPNNQQRQLKKEKASFNTMWWADSNSKTGVNEGAVFDQNYAHQKHAKDMQSSIFEYTHEESVKEQKEQLQQKIDKSKKEAEKLKEQAQLDAKNRQQNRNYSNLNGFSQIQQQQTSENLQQQQGLFPSNLNSMNHDSTLHKINDPARQGKGEDGQESGNKASVSYRREMQSSLDTHAFSVKENPDKQQQQQQKQESDQVQELMDKFNNQQIDDFGNLNEEVKSVQEKTQEASDYNYQQMMKKKEQKKNKTDQESFPEDGWDEGIYKERVSLLQQKQPEKQEVQVIEMNLKGLNEKFDHNKFKKICARKGYHLVDFDVKYNFNKITGLGKLTLRNNRKHADGSEAVKNHLKSLGVKVIREEVRDAQISNGKVQLEADKQKKKLFSQPSSRQSVGGGAGGAGGSVIGSSQVSSVRQSYGSKKSAATEVTDRLYQVKKKEEKKEEPVEPPKKVVKKPETPKVPKTVEIPTPVVAEKKVEQAPPVVEKPVEKTVAPVEKPVEQQAPTPIVEAAPTNQSEKSADTQQSQSQKGHRKTSSIKDLISNSENAPKIIKKRPTVEAKPAENTTTEN